MVSRLVSGAAVACLALSSVTAQADDWEYRLTPYLWFAGLDGNAATIPGLPAAPIKVTPSQALEALEAGIMVMFDAKKGGNGLYMDFIYTDVRMDAKPIPALDLSLRAVTKSTLFTAAYERELVRDGETRLDAMAGARYWAVDSSLAFSGPLGLSGQNKQTWVDPFIGIKGRSRLRGSNFYVAGGAAVGGFDVNSKLFYDLNLHVGYQWTDAIGTSVGYRFTDVNYDRHDFKWDVQQSGWQLGLTWAF
jgi:hypothetical protein